MKMVAVNKISIKIERETKLKSPRESSTFSFCRPVCVHRTDRHKKRQTLKNQKSYFLPTLSRKISILQNLKIGLMKYEI